MPYITVAELYERHLPGQLKNKCRGARGTEKCGPCPSCGGRDRFTVYMNQDGGKGTYSCYQCRRSGDVIQFLRDFEGMSFGEACKAAGRAAPPPRSCPAVPRTVTTPQAGMAAEEARAVAGQKWVEKATIMAGWAFEHLTGLPQPLAWLASRGLPVEAVVRYRLGWNPGEKGKPNLIRARKGWGLPDETPRPDGKARTALWLPRGLVIPLWHGDCAHRLRIRRPESDRSAFLPDLKYYVVPGSGMAPLWLPQRAGTVMPGACAVVVEAELDALAVHHAAGDVCSVLGAGTAQIRRLPPAIMRQLAQCAVILVATDFGDKSDAGRKGWEIWRETFPQARRWPCVGGKDPGEMVQAGRSILPWVLAGMPQAICVAASRALGMDGEADPAAQPSAPPASPAACTLPKEEEAPAPGATQEPSPVMAMSDSTPEAEGDRIRAARALLPLTRTYYGAPQAILEILGIHGLTLRPDGTLSGHERWPLERFIPLFWFCRRHRAALDAVAPLSPLKFQEAK